MRTRRSSSWQRGGASSRGRCRNCAKIPAWGESFSKNLKKVCRHCVFVVRVHVFGGSRLETPIFTDALVSEAEHCQYKADRCGFQGFQKEHNSWFVEAEQHQQICSRELQMISLLKFICQTVSVCVCSELDIIEAPLFDLEVRGVPALQYFGSRVWDSPQEH